MIQHILEELPVIRPLVLVLKQFLLDRGLLTAYTGGLSSYCLFLMVARYCQEQLPTWCDCGSLLMGLLDFYGNYFDPRTTGVSVGKRKYFSRSQVIDHTQPLSTQLLNEDLRWNVSSQQQFNELTRRNSFSDRSYGSGGISVAVPSSRFHMNRQVSLQSQFHSRAPQKQALSHQPKLYTSGKPYTFDPIWVEGNYHFIDATRVILIAILICMVYWIGRSLESRKQCRQKCLPNFPSAESIF